MGSSCSVLLMLFSRRPDGTRTARPARLGGRHGVSSPAQLGGLAPADIQQIMGGNMRRLIGTPVARLSSLIEGAVAKVMGANLIDLLEPKPYAA